MSPASPLQDRSNASARPASASFVTFAPPSGTLKLHNLLSSAAPTTTLGSSLTPPDAQIELDFSFSIADNGRAVVRTMSRSSPVKGPRSSDEGYRGGGARGGELVKREEERTVGMEDVQQADEPDETTPTSSTVPLPSVSFSLAPSARSFSAASHAFPSTLSGPDLFLEPESSATEDSHASSTEVDAEQDEGRKLLLAYTIVSPSPKRKKSTRHRHSNTISLPVERVKGTWDAVAVPREEMGVQRQEKQKIPPATRQEQQEVDRFHFPQPTPIASTSTSASISRPRAPRRDFSLGAGLSSLTLDPLQHLPAPAPALAPQPVPPTSALPLPNPPHPPADPLVDSFARLLSQRQLLPHGLLGLLEACLTEGRLALSGEIKGPSQLALRCASASPRASHEHEHEEQRSMPPPATATRVLRSSSSRGGGGGGKSSTAASPSSASASSSSFAAAAAADPVPAKPHPPYPGALRWVYETGLETFEEQRESRSGTGAGGGGGGGGGAGGFKREMSRESSSWSGSGGGRRCATRRSGAGTTGGGVGGADASDSSGAAGGGGAPRRSKRARVARQQ
ncbi:hypothetical protein JCM1840_004638 [Sporobolomyces johnsonii]